MAFRQPTAAPFRQQSAPIAIQNSTASLTPQNTQESEQSQEWILFAPSQDGTTSHTQTSATQRTPRTAGLSRISDLDSLDTAARSGRPDTSELEADAAEDKELDSLDDGLHAFREPSMYRQPTNQSAGGVLPTHDGLGTFPASSSPVQEQLWQHEQYNPKRKFEGHHRRRSSVQRRLDTIEEQDSRINEEKWLRIERWRIEQSQALVEGIEKQTRRRSRRESGLSTSRSIRMTQAEKILGTTPKASIQPSYIKPATETPETEPFWRRITRRFIQDVIGIDEPLLSVILGESLPPEALDPPAASASLYTIPEIIAEDPEQGLEDASWRDRLLQRIARELGVLVDHRSPHPGAFSTYFDAKAQEDYAGMPIARSVTKTTPSEDMPASGQSNNVNASAFTPTFSPTMENPSHAASWGLEDETIPVTASVEHAREVERLRLDREYWERELDIKMIFQYLRSRFSSGSTSKQTPSPLSASTLAQQSARRAAIIRQHHPLVARAQHSPPRLRRESRNLIRRTSSCASESLKSSRRASLVRSTSSIRNYWDIAGSIGSGSLVASGGMMGAWGEV